MEAWQWEGYAGHSRPPWLPPVTFTLNSSSSPNIAKKSKLLRKFRNKMFVLVLSLSWLEGTGSSLGLSFWPKSEILKINWPTFGHFFVEWVFEKNNNFFSLFALHADELKKKIKKQNKNQNYFQFLPNWRKVKPNNSRSLTQSDNNWSFRSAKRMQKAVFLTNNNIIKKNLHQKWFFFFQTSKQKWWFTSSSKGLQVWTPASL